MFSAGGAAFNLAWGTSQGFVQRKTAMLEARFTESPFQGSFTMQLNPRRWHKRLWR